MVSGLEAAMAQPGERRRHAVSDVVRAATRAPRRPGPRSDRWPATTWRPTPASGSAITGGSTPCGRPAGRGRVWCAGSHPVQPGLPPLPRRAPVGVRAPSGSTTKRSGAPSSCVSSTRRGGPTGRVSRPSGPATATAAGARRSGQVAVLAGAAEPLGRAGAVMHAAGPGRPDPAAQVSSTLDVHVGWRCRHRPGRGGQPQHRPGPVPPRCALGDQDGLRPAHHRRPDGHRQPPHPRHHLDRRSQQRPTRTPPRRERLLQRRPAGRRCCVVRPRSGPSSSPPGPRPSTGWPPSPATPRPPRPPWPVTPAHDPFGN